MAGGSATKRPRMTFEPSLEERSADPGRLSLSQTEMDKILQDREKDMYEKFQKELAEMREKLGSLQSAQRPSSVTSSLGTIVPGTSVDFDSDGYSSTGEH